MTDTRSGTAAQKLEDLLARVEQSKAVLISALEATDPDRFSAAAGEGESVKRSAERMSDDMDFYYGRLAAGALKLPQPPMMVRADFGTAREAAAALQAAHRRFTNLLHDLLPADLEKTVNDADLGSYSLRQILEMAAAQYAMRAQQVKQLAGTASRRRSS